MPWKDKAKAAAHRKARYERDKELENARTRAWKAANPERAAAHLRKCKTGWTDEQYRAKLAEQDGRCGICRADRCSSGKTFAADHDHTTGKPRGVLCGKCNKGLGLLGDNAEGLRRAFAYLVRYETEINTTSITETQNDEDTIHEGATDYETHIQSPKERRGDTVRDVGRDDRPRH
jgi:hypothetical protein